MVKIIAIACIENKIAEHYKFEFLLADTEFLTL